MINTQLLLEACRVQLNRKKQELRRVFVQIAIALLLAFLISSSVVMMLLASFLFYSVLQRADLYLYGRLESSITLAQTEGWDPESQIQEITKLLKEDEQSWKKLSETFSAQEMPDLNQRWRALMYYLVYGPYISSSLMKEINEPEKEALKLQKALVDCMLAMQKSTQEHDKKSALYIKRFLDWLDIFQSGRESVSLQDQWSSMLKAYGAYMSSFLIFPTLYKGSAQTVWNLGYLYGCHPSAGKALTTEESPEAVQEAILFNPTPRKIDIESPSIDLGENPRIDLFR